MALARWRTALRRSAAALLLAVFAATAAALDDTLPRSRLPAEARDTVVVIQRGGPFRYERDGTVFGNYERLLPQRARGYYREYTVITPGLKHRGPRRLVVGCERRDAAPVARARGDFEDFRDCAGPATIYYTDDHYRSFRRVLP